MRSLFNTSGALVLWVVIFAGVSGVFLVSLNPSPTQVSMRSSTQLAAAADNPNQISGGSQPSTDFKPLSDVGNSSGLSRVFSASASGNIGDFVQAIFDLTISIGAMLAVAQITYGGFLYMTKDVANVKNNAKERIQNAVLGLVLLLSIVLILNQINPNIVKLNLNPQAAPTQTGN